MLKDVFAVGRSFQKGKWSAPTVMSQKTMTPIPVTYAPAKTPAMGGRLVTAAPCVIGLGNRIAITVILWIFDNRHNLTNLCKCAIMSPI